MDIRVESNRNLKLNASVCGGEKDFKVEVGKLDPQAIQSNHRSRPQTASNREVGKAIRRNHKKHLTTT